jgi:aldehyde:ferredoxin oxidoreductase
MTEHLAVEPPFGYHGRLLRIDLGDGSTSTEDPGAAFYRTYAGGGLMATALLMRDTPAGLDAFDASAELIFISSVISGYPAAGLPYFSVCAKSPLTNAIGETRAEGPFGIALKGCGYDALIVRGIAPSACGLLVDQGRASVFDASEAWGMDVGEATDWAESRFGPDVAVAAIGPAGERLVRYASIVSSRCHQARRMGMGAVMGSKRLKMLVIRGGGLPPVADQAAVDAITAAYARSIGANDLTRFQKEPPGWMAWIHLLAAASLDVENFRASTFQHVDAYRAEAFEAHYRGPSPCPGCPNDCVKVLHPDGMQDLDPRASGLHQEVTGTLGPNIGMTDVRAVLRANNLCNQWGLDPVSLGFTLSFAMELREVGLLSDADTDGLDLRFGQDDAALEMMRRITFREGLGDLLAEGCRRASERLGPKSSYYALHVKGLEMVCFEPRAQTNLALGFAVAPVGPRYDICEHDWDYDVDAGWGHTLEMSLTLGILERVPMEHLGPDKVRNYKALSTLWSGCDCLGICLYASAPTRLLSVRTMGDLLVAITGWETSSAEIMRWGERRFHLMRMYNLREGLSAADDRLPDRFFEESIASGPKAGVGLDRDRFAASIATYYEMMGWDQDGVPRPATLWDHHLEWTLGGSKGAG